MATFIVKIPHNGKDYYLEWSTITDAPNTYGTSLEAFKDYYQREYGEEGMRHLPERLSRVETKGVSSRIDKNFDELIIANRAGEHETELTKEELINEYCREELYDGIIIAGIKVKEIEALEKENTQLKERIDSYLASLKELEEKLSAKQVDLEEVKANFDAEKLKLERKLAATQARAEDLEHREQKILTQYKSSE